MSQDDERWRIVLLESSEKRITMVFNERPTALIRIKAALKCIPNAQISVVNYLFGEAMEFGDGWGIVWRNSIGEETIREMDEKPTFCVRIGYVVHMLMLSMPLHMLGCLFGRIEER